MTRWSLLWGVCGEVATLGQILSGSEFGYDFHQRF